MSVYTVRRTLLSSDVDARRRLRLSSLFTMLQEAAIAHTTALGMGREKTLDKGLLWIITLQETRITRLPVYDEAVTLTSWPGQTMHLYFPRYSRLTDEAGNVLVENTSLWGLMDRKTRNLIFPEEHGIRIEPDPEDAPLFFPRAPKLPPLAESGRFTVPYSYTDLNGHMNNTRYFDLAEDIMPPALREKEPAEIRNDYTAEAGEGTVIRLKTAAGEELFAAAGFGEKRLFRLMMTFRG